MVYFITKHIASICLQNLMISVRKTKEAGMKVVDVDGSYLHRKRLSSGSITDSANVPGVPLVGWDLIEGVDSKNVDKMPRVIHGKKLIRHCVFV